MMRDSRVKQALLFWPDVKMFYIAAIVSLRGEGKTK